MRVAASLQRYWPRTVLLVVDAWDTIAINTLQHASTWIARLATQQEALLSSECNSWPRCYRQQFMADPELSDCLKAPGRTCFVNGGMYAASAATIGSALLPAMQEFERRRMHIAERTSDQARLTLLRLDQPRRSDRLLRIRIDSESMAMLNLYTCTGANYTRVTGLGHEYCFAREHEPLAGLRVQHGAGKAATYRAMHAGGADALPPQHPVLLHANGRGIQAAQLSSPKLRPLLRVLLDPATAMRLRQHSVLLLDMDEKAVGQLPSCRELSLGVLLEEAGSACNASKRCADKASVLPRGEHRRG